MKLAIAFNSSTNISFWVNSQKTTLSASIFDAPITEQPAPTTINLDLLGSEVIDLTAGRAHATLIFKGDYTLEVKANKGFTIDAFDSVTLLNKPFQY